MKSETAVGKLQFNYDFHSPLCSKGRLGRAVSGWHRGDCARLAAMVVRRPAGLVGLDVDDG